MNTRKKVHLPPLELIRLSLIGKECMSEYPCGSVFKEKIIDYCNGLFYFDKDRHKNYWNYACNCKVIWNGLLGDK